jgi:superfamily II DNA/RNA helicase
MLTGKVPVKKRGALIKEFEDNPDCNVFLSSESGGSGLNLQVADTVINFELPWNPAKKNQRIGRIDRIGQKKQKLHVFNLLSYNSIEMQIATGLLLKQNLFEGVLNATSMTDEVDFSEKGKSQFIKQLEEVMEAENLEPEADGPEQGAEEFMEESISEAPSEKIGAENKVAEPDEMQDRTSTGAGKNGSDQTEEGTKQEVNTEQMEEVMTKGMEFLTGMYKMSTGKDIETTGKPKVQFNKETGEVSVSFKMG